MDDLHLVGLTEDGEHLVLSADGEHLRLPLDDRLLAAIRGDLVRLGQLQIEPESQLRPAEIQARIRTGESAESVAMAAGIPVAKVRRYEGPVLAEREHVARQARRTPVRRRGDGFVPLLGDVVEERLAARGVPADGLAWDSRRLEDGAWEVNVAARTSAGESLLARWAFDPRRAILGPVDDEAHRLSDEQPAQAVPAPLPAVGRAGDRPPELREERRAERRLAAGGTPRRLTSVPPPTLEELPMDLAAVEEALAAQPARAAHPSESARRSGPARADQPAHADQPATSPAATEHTPDGSRSAAEHTPDGSPAAAEHTPDGSRSATEHTAHGSRSATEHTPDGSSAATAGPAPVAGEPVAGQPVAGGPTGARPGAKTRRAAVPAWDDIVFGTRRH